MKEMKYVIMYVVGTRNKGLKMTAKKKEILLHTVIVTSRSTSNIESAYLDLLFF